MSDDALSKRGHALEEEYFRRKDRELIEKLRHAAAAGRARSDMAARIGIDDPEALQELQALGFTPETVILLPLVPVVRMAWADGSVADAERVLIVKLARSRGVTEGSVADGMLSDWLTRQPAPQVVASATRLIAGMLAAHPADHPDLTVDSLVRYCESVAEASGGIFGLHRISTEERALLTSIAGALKAR
ncbi:MAG: hypothetical protein ABI868_06010 [Acidobacteriota bacterium]